jgi:hypothetical protein
MSRRIHVRDSQLSSFLPALDAALSDCLLIGSPSDALNGNDRPVIRATWNYLIAFQPPWRMQ